MRYLIIILLFIISQPVMAAERIMAVKDTNSLLLDNGKQVRLAGILTPERFSYYTYEEQVLNALQFLTMGKQATMHYGSNQTDRYNRDVAQVSIGKTWVQGELLKKGLAIVYATSDNDIMLKEMTEVEEKARQQRLGVWGEEGMQPLQAVDIEDKGNQYRNQFRLVQGVIKEVATTSSRIYLNFGDNWKTDFTIMIEDSHTSAMKAAFGNLAKLQGREVIIRGWMESYNGAVIRLTHPSQLTLLPQAVDDAKTDAEIPENQSEPKKNNE